MVMEDHLSEEEADDLADQLDEEDDTRVTFGFRFQYVSEDLRASPCSPTDIAAVDRALNEQYFGLK
jgi:hypothetical protein